MIDTHCHLYLEEFKADLDDMMKRATDGGVKKFYLPAIDSNTTEEMINMEKKFPGSCFAMIGLHPCSVKENYLQELQQVEDMLAVRKFAAIGEIGLDLYWDKTYAVQQVEAFHYQIKLALQYNLPIVMHTRNAMSETIAELTAYKGKGSRGIFHCFGGSLEEAYQVIALGYKLGIGGVVTYKNSGLAEVLKNISIEHLVLETDAPYLAPVPYRGKRNESSYLKIIAEKIAEIKGVSIEEIDRVTTLNAENIFA